MPARNAARDAEALSLRARGWTYLRIADEQGYANESGARKAVERAMAHNIRESNDEAKSLLLTDLNAAKQAVWAVLEANHLVISEGRVVKLDGEAIPDDAPVLAAVDRLVKIDQELAKIYGAYAPAKHEVRTVDAIDARLLELADEVGCVGSADAPRVPVEA
jgi:hypothetical protein